MTASFVWGMVAGGAIYYVATRAKLRRLDETLTACACGHRLALGVVHRPDSPCYVADNEAVSDDPRHKYTCDWNLYPEQRPDPELCNLGCLDDPEMVKRDRAYVDRQGDHIECSPEAGTLGS